MRAGSKKIYHLEALYDFSRPLRLDTVEHPLLSFLG
jgi:hypothetical protein